MARRPYEKEYTPEPSYEEYVKDQKCDKHEKDEKCDKEKKCEFHFDLSSNVAITQTAEATGGDGGDNNEATIQVAQANADRGATAAAANSISDGIDSVDAPGKSINNTENAEGNPKVDENSDPGQETTQVNKAEINVGGGGNATASNSAEVDITNVVIIPCCSDKGGPPPVYKLGMNGRNLDITTDKNGNTFVNGKKMEAEKLEDGTSVFLFKSHVTKNDGEKGV